MRSMVEGAAAARPNITSEINLIAARPLHRASARSPSPAARGRISVSVLAARHRARAMPTTARRKIKETTKEGGGAPKGACRPLSAPHRQHCCHRHRHGRAPNRGALAFRRFAADSPRQSQPALAQPRAVFPRTRLVRRYPPSPVPVKRAPRRPVLVPDERYPEPPGSGVQIRTRAPHPTPRSGMPREHDPQVSEILYYVLETATNVNEKRTSLVLYAVRQ
jgi:hypothetical protein